jgi:hypothetical protein
MISPLTNPSHALRLNEISRLPISYFPTLPPNATLMESTDRLHSVYVAAGVVYSALIVVQPSFIIVGDDNLLRTRRLNIPIGYFPIPLLIKLIRIDLLLLVMLNSPLRMGM